MGNVEHVSHLALPCEVDPEVDMATTEEVNKRMSLDGILPAQARFLFWARTAT